eukprot:4422515-Pyramimonas_sp.AAC.1
MSWLAIRSGGPCMERKVASKRLIVLVPLFAESPGPDHCGQDFAGWAEFKTRCMQLDGECHKAPLHFSACLVFGGLLRLCT